MNPDPQKSHPTGGFFFSVCRPSASKYAEDRKATTPFPLRHFEFSSSRSFLPPSTFPLLGLQRCRSSQSDHFVTSDKKMPLFDLQNQGNHSMIHKSKTPRSRGTEWGCKALAKQVPCTMFHPQTNI